MEQEAVGWCVELETPLDIGEEAPLEVVAGAPLELSGERERTDWDWDGKGVASSERGRGVGLWRRIFRRQQLWGTL